MEEEKKEELNETNEVTNELENNNIEEIKEDNFFDDDLNDKKPRSKSSTAFLIIFLLVIVVGLIYRLFFDDSRNEKPKENNQNENNQEQINNTTSEYDNLIEKASIEDKIGDYTLYILEVDNEKEYYLVNTLKKEILIKTKNIISNSKYNSDINGTREYELIYNDELKVYTINNNELKEETINNELYERLINEKILNKLNLKSNDIFTYNGEEYSKEQLVIIFNDGCDYHDENGVNHDGISIIYVIDENTNKVTRLNPSLVETNSNICPYEDEDINIYDELKPNSLDNYTIKGKKIINKKTNKEYEIYMGFIDASGEESDYLYVIYNGNLRGIYNKKEGYIIEPLYENVSCEQHSDEAYNICEKSYTTLIDGSKLLSLKTGEILVNTSRINEISNGNFIALVDDKDAVYTSEGKKLFEASYIGYEKSIGYITIENDKFTVYDEKFNKISLPIIEDEKRIKTNNYNMWIPGDLLIKVNVNNNEYFEYNDDKYTGVQTVFIKAECQETDSIYVIEDNKLIKLNKTKVKEDSNICI